MCDRCSCKECIFRKMNEDRTKTLGTRDGFLFCDLGVKNKVKPTDSCVFARRETDEPLTPKEMMQIIKDNVIEFTEDAFLDRRLNLIERQVVKKNIKKYYPDFKG